MPENTPLELVNEESERLQEPSPSKSADQQALHAHATELARSLAWVPSLRSSDSILERHRMVREAIRFQLQPFRAALPLDKPVSDDFRWLHDNVSLLDMELHAMNVKPLRTSPHVYASERTVIPRPVAVAQGYLAASQYQFTEQSFTSYIQAFQEVTVLKMKELSALVSALKLVLLEEIVARAAKVLQDKDGSYRVGVCISSLRDATQASWKDVLEPLILFDAILRQDPAGAYPHMDFDSRELYRKKVVIISQRSDCTETEVANEALVLAREAALAGDPDPRLTLRRSHIGYYLLAEGKQLLRQRVHYRPRFTWLILDFLRSHPEEFYLPGVEILTFVIMSLTVLIVTRPNSPPGLIFLALLALLLPSSQSAVQLMNYLATSLLRAEILPKLDFSDGIPDDCVTLVAVPTLLLNKKQVHHLVENLEVRFLGNRDRNLHFVLLSDLPDSRHTPREDNPLIDLCAQLVRKLNQKYAAQRKGSFLLLHRHRIYNPREKVWMGWERKRGKLMDLNKLLRGNYDGFPVKEGDLSVLSGVRYVITLDSDTELPRGSAHRMIGALAHPLNQAIVDPEKNIAVAGYGILQPRVGVSVQSAAKSRLAAIYSGETGFDIYTRAISDVYQDLFGEATFAGKGIYEVATLHRVLDRRFPRNALLSHDLIEGAYARAGLVSDIEVIEDYPSHYSAYNRRKHRWLRGDWQITAWLLPHVRDESGERVPNPISLISQWKILDNLRRSLVEPATLVLFVLGWIVLPGRASSWTLAILAILFVPTWCRFAFELIRASVERKAAIAEDAVKALFAANVNALLSLIFLAHQMLLSIDAVVRTLVRRLVTRERLLQWETAAQAEMGMNRRTPLDIYLDWTPALVLGIAALVWFVRPWAIFSALPILLLWVCSKLVSRWLNCPPRARQHAPSAKDQSLLRYVALHTWRYFAEFSNAEHHWLVPDNVQEEPACVAARVSPTNLGLLLNARQAACEFGYLALDEFAEQTLRTLATMSGLEHYRGHLFNWYDTHSLTPLLPKFVSSVDSGNLLASLWTLEQGCWDRLKRPLLQRSLADGFLDHLGVLVFLRALPRRRAKAIRHRLDTENWLDFILDLSDSDFESPGKTGAKYLADAKWFKNQTAQRLEHIRQLVATHYPWRLPEFAVLRSDLNLLSADNLPLELIPAFIDRLVIKLQLAAVAANGDQRLDLQRRLQCLLPAARSNILALIEDLQTIATDAGRMANEMDFRFLRHRRRKLLSVGYDAGARQLNAACYDLLASEARIATFVAIAKDDIPQETWFLLGRVHAMDHGRAVLLSWTGTMFEYLMPAIWMRSYSQTLLDRTRDGAVQAQRLYTARKRIPWGISESAYSRRDPAGNYGYHAFGLPHLALRERDVESLVISPYSTFLALHADSVAALRNLRTMTKKGWCGRYGFYEAIDFSPQEPRSWRHNYEIVRCWMAHHQGMTLLSIANLLFDGIAQRWFHCSPLVQATELLLHEKPVAHLRPVRTGYGTAVA
ncbi:MAG TPA: glucoamylase family protein [Terriglobales bacterium]|nr:glucoamylase family protein [Terriglobales bacterium]